MSTLIKLMAYEAEQPPRLIRFLPRLIGVERERRKITMTPDLHEWLHKPARSLTEIKAAARAHFGQLVKGEPIDDCRFMKRVEDRRITPPDFSHDVWWISPRFSDPQFRFFGTFVRRDWFLATSKQDRARLEEHQ